MLSRKNKKKHWSGDFGLKRTHLYYQRHFDSFLGGFWFSYSWFICSSSMYTESLCRWHWWCIAACSISQTILVPLSSDSYNPDSCVCLSVIMKGFFPRKESRPAERERHNASQRVYTAVRSQILGHVPQLARFDSPWVSHTNATRRNMPAAERCAASSLTCVCLFHFQMWKKSEKKKGKERSVAALLICSAVAQRRERHLGNSPLFGSCWLATLVVDLIQLIY